LKNESLSAKISKNRKGESCEGLVESSVTATKYLNQNKQKLLSEWFFANSPKPKKFEIFKVSRKNFKQKPEFKEKLSTNCAYSKQIFGSWNDSIETNVIFNFILDLFL
jgi:hypothetical protein